MSVSLFAKNSAGAPLTGLTLTWYAYKNALTGANVTGPTISEQGAGFYKFDRVAGIDSCGIVDCGATANPRYLILIAETIGTVAAFDSAGTPLAGLVLTWSELKKVSDFTSFTPQPTFTGLGLGLYTYATVKTEHVVGKIDLTATATPQYWPYDSETDIAPAVQNVLPSVSTQLTRTTAITFDVVDAFEANDILRTLPMVYYPGLRDIDLPHDGETFREGWTRFCTRTSIAGGFHYTLLPDDGWQSGPTLIPFVFSKAGNEAP